MKLIIKCIWNIFHNIYKLYINIDMLFIIIASMSTISIETYWKLITYINVTYLHILVLIVPLYSGRWLVASQMSLLDASELNLESLTSMPSNAKRTNEREKERDENKAKRNRESRNSARSMSMAFSLTQSLGFYYQYVCPCIAVCIYTCVCMCEQIYVDCAICKGVI